MRRVWAVFLCFGAWACDDGGTVETPVDGGEVDGARDSQVDRDEGPLPDAGADAADPDSTEPDAADGAVPDEGADGTPADLGPDDGVEADSGADMGADSGPDMGPPVECMSVEDCEDLDLCTTGACVDGMCQQTEEPGCCDANGDCESGACIRALNRCADAAEVGALLISEIMVDPQAVDDASGEWVEVYNPGADPVLLNGWTLSGGDGERHLIEPIGRLEVPAGGVVVLAAVGLPGRNGQVQSNYTYDGFSLVNGGDRVALVDATGVLIDEVVYDGDWPVESGASLSLSIDRSDAEQNDQANAWCAGMMEWAPGADRGTPGFANPPCPGADITVDWCRYQFPREVEAFAGASVLTYGRVFDEGITDRSDATDPSPQLLAQAGYGPDGSQPGPEWTWFDAVPNQGWNAAEANELNNDEYQAEVVVPMPGRYDLAFRFSLNDGADWLYCDGPGPDGDGAEDGYSPENAGDLTSVPGPCDPNPCDAPPAATCEGNLATTFVAPGACAVVDDAAECAYPPEPVDCTADDLVCRDGACVEGAPRPAADQVVITEIMYDTQDPLAEDAAEWIELYNPTELPLRLDGCILADSANEVVIERLPIPAGGYALLARSDDPAENGGLVVDGTFSFGLNNGGDTISLRCGDVVVDEVAYDDGGEFPDARQVSIAFDPDAADNSLGASWCLGQEEYGDGHLGSPGAANPPCPAADITVDFCRLQFPLDVEAGAGSALTVFGRVYEEGLTDLTDGNDLDEALLGQVGYGAAGTPPDDGWTWAAAEPNPGWNGTDAGEPNNDEYQGSFGVPAPGDYDFVFRFSVDGGETWLVCDRNGSDDGFQIENAGHLTSVASPCEAEACDAPPAADCAEDGVTRRVYEAPGACIVENEAAVCTYPFVADDCSRRGGTCDAGECVGIAGPPAADGLTITEIMYDPQDPLGEGEAEWFEVRNDAAERVSLDGCLLADQNNQVEVAGVVLEPGQYAVFGQTDDAALNGGIEPVALFPFGLNNGGDTVEIRCGETVIASVAYGDEFPSARQGSIQLDPAAEDNADGGNWCPALPIYFGGEVPHRGTPGAENPPCDDVQVDFCRLQFPVEVAVPGGSLVVAYGRVFEGGITDLSDGVDPGLFGQLGYGAADSQPDDAWTWFDGVPTPDWSAAEAGEPGNDEYEGAFVVPAQGEYDFAWRFSTDGANWLYCDRDRGEGRDGSEDGYAPADAGELISQPGPCEGAVCDAPPLPRCDVDGVTRLVPGAGVCEVVDAQAQCSYPEQSEDCSVNGGRCEGGLCVGGAQRPAQGEVIITEIMYDTEAPLAENRAEWFEIYNLAPEPRSLNGCLVADTNNDTTIEGLVLAPGEYALFGRSAEALENGGIVPDHLFDFGLNNGDEALQIRCDDAVVDSVIYDDGGDYPDARSSSIQLDPGAYGSVANDDGRNWCLAELVYFADGTPHRGTPGQANPQCPVAAPCEGVVCDAPPADDCRDDTTRLTYQNPGICRGEGECDYAEIELNCALDGRICEDGACVDPEAPAPAAGEVVFTEIMYDPHNGLSDASAEWVELTSRADGPRSLRGCILSDAGGGMAVLPNLVAEPGQNVLGGRNVGSDVNGGLVIDFVFRFGLDNAGDTLVFSCGGVEIDRFTYDVGGDYPRARATSLQLDVNADDNDDPANWCRGMNIYLADPAHRGTPKAPNEACPNDACVDVVCDAPPAPSCDGNTRVVTLDGVCIEGLCGYEEQREDCAFGCIDGACIGDLCDDVECPDLAVCDGDTAVTSSNGICVGGACGYEEAREDCANGCLDGGCVEAEEVDYCRLQFPLAINEATGAEVTVFGIIYQEGVTDRTPGFDADPSIAAEVGYGPDGTAPGDNPDAWTWSGAFGNGDWDGQARGEPNNDEYLGTLTVPADGVYDFAYRFSADGGATWTYCDGGEGSFDGYQPEQAGQMVVNPPEPRAPAVGEVIVSEVMYDTQDPLEEAAAEWIELRNLTGEPIELINCGLGDRASLEVFVESVVIAPNDYAVFVRSDVDNGDIVADGLFGFSLNNGGDEVRLVCGDDVIDSIEYDDGPLFPDARARSISLDPSAADADANDQGGNWCLALDATLYFEGPEAHYGTPGTPNPVCPEIDPCEPNPCDRRPRPECVGDVATSYVEVGVCEAVDGLAECTYAVINEVVCPDNAQACLDGACVNEGVVEPGQVIINELMYDPHLGLDDNTAEWIELLNVSGGEVDLSTCSLVDELGSRFRLIIQDLVLADGEIALFARSTDPAINGGLVPHQAFDFGLNNGGDSVYLTCAGVVIDVVTYDDAPEFPNAQAASISLDPDLTDAENNDFGANWCLGQAVYAQADGDNLGTPGAPNEQCADVDVTVDFCRLQFPLDAAIAPNESVLVYGQMYEEGLTDRSVGVDLDPRLTAQAGYGADGSDPAAGGWTWFDAIANPDWDGAASGRPNDDEYQAEISGVAAGVYDLAYRFSLDGGRTWLYCDEEPGSSNGYDPADAGALTVE